MRQLLGSTVGTRKSQRNEADRLQAQREPETVLLAERDCPRVSLRQSTRRIGANLLRQARRNAFLPARRGLADGSFLTECADAPGRVIACGIEWSDHWPCRLLAIRLDPLQIPAVELAAPCHERQEIETTHDELETHLPACHPILGIKTPELVCRDMGCLLLTH